jgi:hypothetical protein
MFASTHNRQPQVESTQSAQMKMVQPWRTSPLQQIRDSLRYALSQPLSPRQFTNIMGPRSYLNRSVVCSRTFIHGCRSVTTLGGGQCPLGSRNQRDASRVKCPALKVKSLRAGPHHAHSMRPLRVVLSSPADSVLTQQELVNQNNLTTIG